MVAYENVEKFNEAIDQVPSPKERLLEQTFVLSKVVMRKYKLLRLGLLFLLFAILAVCGSSSNQYPAKPLKILNGGVTRGQQQYLMRRAGRIWAAVPRLPERANGPERARGAILVPTDQKAGGFESLRARHP